MTAKKTKLIAVRCAVDDIAAVDRIAESQRRDRSSLINEAIRRIVSMHDTFAEEIREQESRKATLFSGFEVRDKRTAKLKKRVAKATAKKKLSKADPDFYKKIGLIAGKKILKERGKKYYSDIAKKSHPRAEYHGGRPPKGKK